jgi:hypothetical protein
MSDPKPIEAVSASEKAVSARPPRPEVPHRQEEAKPAEAAKEGAASAAEPSSEVRPYRVVLDPETTRIFTEVINPHTGEVILRIPPGYSPREEPADISSKEIEL